MLANRGGLDDSLCPAPDRMRPPQRPEPERGTLTHGYDIEPYRPGHLPDTAFASVSTSMGRECIGESALVRCMRHRGNPGRYARSPIRALRRNGTSPGTIRNHRRRPHMVSPPSRLSSGPGGSCRLPFTHRTMKHLRRSPYLPLRLPIGLIGQGLQFMPAGPCERVALTTSAGCRWPCSAPASAWTGPWR